MIYTFSYILLSAVFGILVHIIGNNMPPWLLIFLCSANSLLVFHALNLFSLRKMYAQLFKQDPVVIAATMFFIALSTIGSFFIPIHFMPAEFLFSYVCGITLFGSLDSYRKSKSAVDKWQLIALVLLLGLFYFIIYNYFSAKQYLIFILATLLVSVVTYAYFKLSYKLYQNEFSALSILAVRMWPLMIISGGWSLQQHYFAELSLAILLKVFLISIVLLIIPVFLCQKSIEKSGPDIHAIFMGFIPFLTISLDVLFWGQHQLSKLTIFFWLLALCLALVIAAAKLFKLRLSTSVGNP